MEGGSRCGSAAPKEMGGLVVVWMSQHEGNLMKLAAGCPLVEVQWTLYSTACRAFSSNTIILLGSYRE